MLSIKEIFVITFMMVATVRGQVPVVFVTGNPTYGGTTTWPTSLPVASIYDSSNSTCGGSDTTTATPNLVFTATFVAPITAFTISSLFIVGPATPPADQGTLAINWGTATVTTPTCTLGTQMTSALQVASFTCTGTGTVLTITFTFAKAAQVCNFFMYTNDPQFSSTTSTTSTTTATTTRIITTAKGSRFLDYSVTIVIAMALAAMKLSLGGHNEQ